MKRFGFLLAPLAGLSLLSAPAALAAQEDNPPTQAEMEQAMALFGDMFPVEPLTPEQEARLPQAQRIIARMIPDGTMAEMMGTMFDKMLGPMLAAAEAPAMDAVTKGTGIAAAGLDLTPERAAEIAVLFDPAYAERHEREKALFPALMRDMMSAMEPMMRKAMSELYAIHFSATELDGIEAFFQSDIGTSYARKSFSLASDPRVMGATMQAMPELMFLFSEMERKMVEASADLPPRRSFADLSAAEKKRVADAMGYSVAELEAEAARAASPVEIESEPIPAD
jgi:hypothetical protein